MPARAALSILAFALFSSVCGAFDPAAAGTSLFHADGWIGRVNVTRSGAFTLTNADGLGHRFDGVIYQKLSRGAGLFLGINSTGNVEVLPIESSN